MKTCSTCKETKQRSEFSGREYRCKACLVKKSMAWNLANRERKNASNRRHYAKYRDRYRLQCKAWQSKNGAAFDAERYPRRKASMIERNKWKKAQLLRACPKWANRFFISEAYELAALRTKMLGYPWHVDHIVPLRSKLVCGLHVEHNLSVIPGALNMSKQNFYWPEMPEVT